MNEASTNFEKGYPKKRGLYRCLVNGKEQVLVHHYCGMNRRHWWTYTSGHDVLGEILYYPKPVAVRKQDV